MQYISRTQHTLEATPYREYTMRSRGGLVHSRLRDRAIGVSQEEVVEGLLFVRRQINREISEWTLGAIQTHDILVTIGGGSRRMGP